jgi:hypothetical protein
MPATPNSIPCLHPLLQLYDEYSFNRANLSMLKVHNLQLQRRRSFFAASGPGRCPTRLARLEVWVDVGTVAFLLLGMVVVRDHVKLLEAPDWVAVVRRIARRQGTILFRRTHLRVPITCEHRNSPLTSYLA